MKTENSSKKTVASNPFFTPHIPSEEQGEIDCPTPSSLIAFPDWFLDVEAPLDPEFDNDAGARLGKSGASVISWKARGSREPLESIDASVEKWLGLPEEDWRRPGFWERRIHPSDRESFLHFHRGIAEEPGLHLHEYRMLTAAEEVKWVREFSCVSPVYGREKLIRGLFMDATEEHTLREDVVSLSNLERSRIGRELHEDFSQSLAGIACLSRQLERRLTRNHPDLAGIAGEITVEISQALKRARSLSHELAPHQLDDSELVPHLHKFARETAARTGVQCEAVLDPSIQVVDRNTRLALYRLCQEATRNAIQHGKATRVEIGLKRESDSRCQLAIKDNGIGFDRANPSSDGLGIRLMKYRCHEIGATLALRNDPRSGAVVECKFSNPSTP